MLRVLIIDDHPMFRMGLSAVALGDMDGIELVGEANAADEVAAADRVGPVPTSSSSTSGCPTAPVSRSTAGWPAHHPKCG